MIREHIGPVASFKQAAAVRGLPLTRTGKICRKSIADLARNKLKKISGTVVDPTQTDICKEEDKHQIRGSRLNESFVINSGPVQDTLLCLVDLILASRQIASRIFSIESVFRRIQIISNRPIVNWTPKLGEYAVMKNIQRALDTWGSYGRLNFQRVSNNDADIVVSFATGDHGDAFPFDGRGGVLGHAFFPFEGSDIGGDIHFDADEEWTSGCPDMEWRRYGCHFPGMTRSATSSSPLNNWSVVWLREV
ncbi:hypothetical protein NQ318_010119 [Aromia moschata]|uniref:Peptidase metallopeptidase domain-containing protein n=1 Tax=Aromia moschata TaxID=1265417 RepID=A0AAV8Y4E9_9CUCU|nr:hypothetical protein NQ318_010119 [Aromia moschata]